MRCTSKGILCKSCTHNLSSGRCSKSHWLDMIGRARGEKPTRSLYKHKQTRRKKK